MTGEKLTVSEVARMAGVTAATVRRWSDAGDLPSTRTLGGARRFDRSTVEERLRDASR
jgi:excisionase family DNA binding protein